MSHIQWLSWAISQWGLIVGLVLLCIGSATVTAQDSPPVVSNVQDEPALKAKLAERDALWEQAMKLAAAGKTAEAIAAGEQVLQRERELFGQTHAELMGTLEWLTQQYLAQQKMSLAEERAVELLRVQEAVHGKDGWQTISARWRLDYVQKLAQAEAEMLTKMLAIEAEYDRLRAAGEHAAAAAKIGELIPLEESVLGSDHSYFANTFLNQAFCFQDVPDLMAAESAAARALTIRQTALGAKHPDTAEAAWLLARTRIGKEKHDEALEPLEIARDAWHASGDQTSAAWIEGRRGDSFAALERVEEAKDAYELALGAFQKLQNVDGEAVLLKRLAELCLATGDWGRAETLLTETLQRETERWGADDWRVTDARLELEQVHRLASVTLEQRKQLRLAVQWSDEVVKLYHAGQYADAFPLAQQVCDVREQILGKQHPDCATSLNDLALLYVSIGDYPKAESLNLVALGIREKSQGKQHPYYANSLDILANLYKLMGDFARAKPLFLEALAIREKALGKEHLDYAKSLNNLAILYQSISDQARAEPMYLEALAILEKLLGKEHPDYATILNNLANLYLGIGDYVRAEPMYLKALVIDEKVLGKEHPGYAISLNNLANLYNSMRDYARAESLFREASTIQEKVLGKKHPDYATSLNNLANLYFVIGDDEQAELLYRKALAIREQVLGKEHPSYANSLISLAGFYQWMADYARAEPMYLEAQAICEKVLGKIHPQYAGSLHCLATSYYRTKDYPRAESLYRESLRIARQVLENSALIQSERQQLAMSQTLRYQLDSFLSMVLATGEYQAAAARELLSWKGATLVRQRAMRLAADDPPVSDLFRELQSVSMRLASLSRSVPTENLDDWRERVLGLTAEKENLEVQLSRDSAAFRAATQVVTLEQIQAAIPPGGVLIDYLQFQYSQPTEKNGQWRSEESLVATIVPAQGEPVLVNLGPVYAISQSIDTWRLTFGMSPQGKQVGQQLRRLIWEPVLAKLAELEAVSLGGDAGDANRGDGQQPVLAETLLVSADGVLGRLPLGGLPGKAPGTYLIEDHRLAMIPVPQLLPDLVNNLGRKELSRELLLLGDVDYDSQPQAAPQEPRKRPRPRRSTEAEFRFGSLEGTRGEIATIRKTYADNFELKSEEIETLERALATEARFRELAPQFYHLHLATHGFFAPESMKSALSTQEFHSNRSGRFSLAGEDMQVRGYNPGLLSGLALAGANRPPVDDADDGILTAQEIAFLPLGGVETVVLSACETGLGNTAGGEGLLGVQRAFQIAGARTTMASFWKVDDLVTRVLMERFYSNLWDKEMPRLDALREAQLYVLNNPQAIRGAKLEQSEESSVRASPYFWAAFSLAGDWR